MKNNNKNIVKKVLAWIEYAVAIRYPTEYTKIKKREAVKTIRTAINVRNVIRDLLESEGFKDKNLSSHIINNSKKKDEKNID